ncbi:hypothetical protein SESBI_38545 [Sesbania bispinosa]|nr:hypothetical protein SESBI_38545 [Sesbania bispinosa]
MEFKERNNAQQNSKDGTSTSRMELRCFWKYFKEIKEIMVKLRHLKEQSQLVKWWSKMFLYKKS